MSGAPPDIVVPIQSAGTTIHSLPSSNAAGTTDTVALPVQGVTGGVPLPASAASGAFADGSIATIGTEADAAWSGSGSSTVVAALKALYNKLAGTLTASISGAVAVTGTFWQTVQPVSGTFWQATQPVSIAAPVPVSLVTGAPTSPLTRPLNIAAYASGNLIGSSTTAVSVVVPSFAVPANAPVISALRLWTNAAGWAGVTIVVTLWSTAPTYANGDGGVYAVNTGAAGFLGQFSFSLIQFGDGACGRAGMTAGPALVLPSSLTTVYWDAEIFAAATPISGQVFHLTAETHG